MTKSWIEIFFTNNPVLKMPCVASKILSILENAPIHISAQKVQVKCPFCCIKSRV